MKIGTATTPLNNPLKKPAFACLTVFLALLMAGCGQANHAQLASQENLPLKVSEAAQHIKIKLGIEHNYLTAGCPNNTQDCYRATMTLQLPTNMPQDWRILFSHLSPINKSISEAFNLSHINGDMHQISPKAVKLQANTAYKITFYGNTPLVSGSVLFPNYLLVAGDGKTSIIASTTEHIAPGHQVPSPQHIMPFTRPEQMLRKADDKVAIADANERFARFSARTVNHTAAQAPRIIPQLHTAKWSGTTIELHTGLRLPKMPKNLATAVIQRFNANAIETSPQGLPIMAKLQTDATPQSYVLSISTNKIQIDYGDSAGFYYAMMSIAQLYDASSQSLPIGVIHDQPNMAFRGLHIDVSRNFRSKDFILQTLDQMSYYKLNKLHLHLAEDEGWRLEIPDLPELTQVGSKRCMNLSDEQCLQPQLGGAKASNRDGFYTVNDYKDILRFASKHHIQVIPSLDMPGHSRAAIKSMEARYHSLMQAGDELAAKQYLLSDFADKTQYHSIQNYTDNTLNICMDSTYSFIDKVLNELKIMHEQAQHPLALYHIGADETAGAWLDSPACTSLIKQQGKEHLGAHFIERVSMMVANKGISVGGWNDGLKETRIENMPKDTYSYIWGALPWGAHKQVSEQSHRGWGIVLSIPDVLYFDFPYQIDPKEPGYNWASRRITTRSLFNFMPDNLPIHAEFRLDTLGKNFVVDDRLQKDEKGNISHQPLAKGFKVKGIQGQLWSETVRSEQQAQYLIFPRLLALAERAWHQASWQVPYDYNGKRFDKNTGFFTQVLKTQRDKNWLYFSQTLGFKELAKLEHSGIFYRLPSVGAKIDKGKLHLNSAILGLPIEYQETGKNWQRYSSPISMQGDIKIRTKTITSKRSGRASIIEK